MIKQYNIRGKGLFDIQPKYHYNDIIIPQTKKYPVKSFNN